MSLRKLSRVLSCFIFCITPFVNAQKTDKPLDVIIQSATTHTLQNNIEALGNLRANESTALTSKVSKIVTHINFEDGQRVEKNTLLVSMANAEEAALMNEARLNADDAKRQLDRVQSLSKTGAISAALLDQNKRDYAAARERFAALEARFNDLFVRAPFDGVLGLRNVSVGSLIAPGQVITIINDDSKMKLDFTVPAIYLRSLRVGLPVEATSVDLGKKIFEGKILSVDNQIDESTRSIKVRALLDNPKLELKQGLLMNLLLHADVRKALVINEAALVPLGSDNFIFVLRQQNSAWVAEKRAIQIGQRYQGVVEVVSGLQEKEKVITHGLQKVRHGQLVNIIAEESNDPNKKRESLEELLKQKVGESGGRDNKKESKHEKGAK
ncbi:MAG: efflux RND transporter periplasmic adaptor subunit [Moraxellaceae bacterium]|nr:MAG: efflux RND transporter periplasmic adaptor subunit [Moraxellaceae bacterium]